MSCSRSRFSDVLAWLAFDDEVLDWIKTGLRQSHQDAKREHDTAVTCLQAEYDRLGTRINAIRG